MGIVNEKLRRLHDEQRRDYIDAQSGSHNIYKDIEVGKHRKEEMLIQDILVNKRLRQKYISKISCAEYEKKFSFVCPKVKYDITYGGKDVKSYSRKEGVKYRGKVHDIIICIRPRFEEEKENLNMRKSKGVQGGIKKDTMMPWCNSECPMYREWLEQISKEQLIIREDPEIALAYHFSLG